jgi:hypothetical protein
MVPKRRFPRTGFRPGGVASPGRVSPHRTQLGVVCVADQLADGRRFPSLTVVDILRLDILLMLA